MTTPSLSNLENALIKLTSAISYSGFFSKKMEQEEDTSALYFLASGLDKIHDDIDAFYDAAHEAARSMGPRAVS